MKTGAAEVWWERNFLSALCIHFITLPLYVVPKWTRTTNSLSTPNFTEVGDYPYGGEELFFKITLTCRQMHCGCQKCCVAGCCPTNWSPENLFEVSSELRQLRTRIQMAGLLISFIWLLRNLVHLSLHKPDLATLREHRDVLTTFVKLVGLIDYLLGRGLQFCLRRFFSTGRIRYLILWPPTNDEIPGLMLLVRIPFSFGLNEDVTASRGHHHGLSVFSWLGTCNTGNRSQALRHADRIVRPGVLIPNVLPQTVPWLISDIMLFLYIFLLKAIGGVWRLGKSGE